MRHKNKNYGHQQVPPGNLKKEPVLLREQKHINTYSHAPTCVRTQNDKWKSKLTSKT